MKEKETTPAAMSVCPKSEDSRWVALNDKNAIISEGKTPVEARDLAQKISEKFSLMFVPIKGATYIF